MIIDEMLTLWITINPTDLQCLLVIRLAEVKLNLESDVVSVFARKTATMNPVALAKFFDITCKVVLLSLFASKHRDGGLLGPVSTYFGTIKLNGRSIIHLDYLV